MTEPVISTVEAIAFIVGGFLVLVGLAFAIVRLP